MAVHTFETIIVLIQRAFLFHGSSCQGRPSYFCPSTIGRDHHWATGGFTPYFTCDTQSFLPLPPDPAPRLRTLNHQLPTTTTIISPISAPVASASDISILPA